MPSQIDTRLEHVCALWTYCYHVTAAINRASIRESRTLFPAASLFERAGQGSLSEQRRTEDVLLGINGSRVLIRNQRSLDPASLDLGASGTLEEYVAYLNRHVCFWPGTASGPTDDGIQMLRRTNTARSMVIRAPTRSLFKTNRASLVGVSTCNAGAAWMEDGVKSRRRVGVFQNVGEYSGEPAAIVEISLASAATLPNDSEYSDSLGGQWRALSTPGRPASAEMGSEPDREP